jgi:biopolymer transport protein ExbB
MLTITLMLILVWNGPAWTQDDAAATWETIHEDLAEQTRTIAKEVKTTKAIITREQTELEARTAELKAAIAKEQKRLNERKREFNRLLAQEQKSRLALEEHQEDIKNLETVIRSAAREADTMIHDSLISPAFAERQKMISPLLDADRFPGFADIEKLIGLFFQEAEETGKTTLINNSIIGPDGGRTSAEVLRIGAFTAFYRLDNGRVGYLRTGKDGKTWIAVPASLGRNVVNRIEAAFDGQSPDIPLDISRGAALQGLGQQKDALQWLRSGGVLVWPILFVGGIALLLTFERVIVLLRQKTTPGAVMTRILTLVRSNDWEGCKQPALPCPASRHSGSSAEALRRQGLPRRFWRPRWRRRSSRRFRPWNDFWPL